MALLCVAFLVSACKSHPKRAPLREPTLPAGVPREVTFFVEDTMSVRRSGKAQFTSFAISIRDPQAMTFSVGVCDWPGHTYVARQFFQIPSSPEHFAKFIAATQFPAGPIPIIVAYQGYALQSLKNSLNSPFAMDVLRALEQALAREGVQYELVWEPNLALMQP